MDDEPIFVASEIENNPVIAHEIDGATELPFYFGLMPRALTPRALGRATTLRYQEVPRRVERVAACGIIDREPANA